ncbi:Rieske (2Fe-2S) protein [Streptomyces sp. NPDC005435]|uniref:Rieske (2Fe-2S) protein n=1 Tax=Streptomyces sp. NPDC005435 TaxID=3154464 RepID=UPI003456CAA9
MTQPATRRTLLATGAATLAVCCVGCGGDDSAGSTAEATPGSTGGENGSAPAAQALARTADIPEGGGKIFADQKIVVTQPVKGEYKAFSAVCTHQGCALNQVVDGMMDCPCHGSKFRITDGSVAQGPATQPLAARPIQVRGNSITLG